MPVLCDDPVAQRNPACGGPFEWPCSSWGKFEAIELYIKLSIIYAKIIVSI